MAGNMPRQDSHHGVASCSYSGRPVVTEKPFDETRLHATVDIVQIRKLLLMSGSLLYVSEMA
jgi:hypothetical protein